MSLRDQAALDAQAILEDVAEGFGTDVEVTDPDGRVFKLALKGITSDVHQTIDPDTGVAVSGRRASVVLPIAALTAQGLGPPQGIADPSKRPWVMSFADTAGVTHTFKVTEAMPDRTIGIVVCTLESWQQ